MGETLAAGERRLPRASDLSGSGLSNAPPIGVLGHGSGALLGGLQAQPATPLRSPPAAGAPSASPAGSSQALPLVSTPAGLACGVAAYLARDQVFAPLSLGFPAVRQASTSGRGSIVVIEPRPLPFGYDPFPFPRGRSGRQGSRISRASVSMSRASATEPVHQAEQYLRVRVAGKNQETSCAHRTDARER
jgi:hypothetical protein